jgi:hypothetical protein
MSSSIWTRCADGSEERLFRTLRLAAWRVVESQRHISTRRLVDSLEEQALLEELIESAKPPNRTDPRLHYLLSTPFRYPPLAHGSRFGGRFEPGIWYGSTKVRTALAEVAYYRFLFVEGTSAPIAPVAVALTAFSVRARSTRGIDLSAPPFDSHHKAIASPVRYTATQPLGAAMRAAGVELFRYPSARDDGVNVGLFTPKAFGHSKPAGFEQWECLTLPDRVECVLRDYVRSASLVFPRERDLVDGKLPAPALR